MHFSSRLMQYLLPVSLLVSGTKGFASFPKRSASRKLVAMQESKSDNNEVKGVIFDIDGTLADSWKLGFDATLVVLERNQGPTITEEIYHDCCKYATPERLARHVGLEPGDSEFEKVGNKLAKEFDDLYVDLVNLKTAGFYDGIHDIIHSIPNDVKVGALTNACVKYAHAVLTANCPVKSENTFSSDLPVYERFMSIQGADTVPKPKPNPDGLLVCCKEMGLKPEQGIYVGDSPSDGLAANAAGMTSIGVLWGSNSEEKMRKAPFDKLCSSTDELRSVLQEMMLR